MRTRRMVLALAALSALAACGTTVPQTTQLTAGSAGGGQVTTGSGEDSAGPASTTAVPPIAGGAATTTVTATDSANQLGSPATTGTTAASVVTGVGGSRVISSPGARATAGTGSGTVGKPKVVKTAAATKPTAGKTAATTAGGSTAATTAGVTSPLTIGLAYTDNSGGSAAFGLTESGLTPKAAAEAIVKGINATGGLDGRMLVPIEFSFNTDENNYSTEASAACAMFTQDNHVPVVLDTSFGENYGFDTCLAQAGVLLLTTYGESDAATSAASPLHADPGAMNVDRNYASVLTDLDQSGYLTKNNQLGILLESCPKDQAAYKNTLLPLVQKLGLKTPTLATSGCTTGIGSAGAASTDISGAVLTFRQDNVDRVMIVSDFEATALLLFANAASTQKYDPGYVLSSNAGTALNRASLPSDQWPQLVGAGYTPLGDVDNPPAPLPAEKRCLAIMQAAQVTPASTDMGIVYAECNPALLLEAALKQTNGNSTPQALVTAIAGLGNAYASPGVLGDSTTFSSSRHDGPDEMQLFAYNAGCTCIRSSGAPIPTV